MIFKVDTQWSGTSGGPGLTQSYFEDIGSASPTQTQAQTAVNAVRAFWEAIKALLPDDIVLTVSTQVDVFDQVDGELVGSIVAATAPASVTGTASGAFSMPAGIKVSLHTNEIRNGRRVRGSIYIVPSSGAATGANGLVLSTTRTTVNNAGGTLITAVAGQNVNMIVWGRPVKDALGNVTRNGTVNYVQSFATSEKGAILRGRRD